MLIRPFVEDYRLLTELMEKRPDPQVKECKRDIYINQTPTMTFDDSWEGLHSMHVVVTIVNKSFIVGDLLLEETYGADWVFLKSIYVFTTDVKFGSDVLSTFKGLSLYPQSELTTGYYFKNGQIHDLGVSITDLDHMSSFAASSSSIERGDVSNDISRLKVVDPRFYSDREHHQNLLRFPDDFLPKMVYKGSELIDQKTLFYVAQNVPELTIMDDSVIPPEPGLPLRYNETMNIRSFWMMDVMYEMLHFPSIGVFDELVFTYDSSEGIWIHKNISPSCLPDDFVKLRTKEFADHATAFFQNLELKIGNIRVMYHRLDMMDRLRVFFKDGNIRKEGTTMSCRTFRSDAIDDILISTRHVR